MCNNYFQITIICLHFRKAVMLGVCSLLATLLVSIIRVHGINLVDYAVEK